MEQKNALIALMVVITAAGNYMVMAQTSSSGCTMSILGLAPCINFLNASNGIPAPLGCCTAFSSFVDSSATCACQLLAFMPTNSSSLSLPLPSGFAINQTQLLNLPGLCQVDTPQCQGAGVAPTTSPDASGETSTLPNEAESPAPAPSAGFPSTPSAVGSSPPSHARTSDAKSLFTPSFFSVFLGMIIGSLLL